MKFLFVDTYYPAFLKYFRKKYPELNGESYKRQKETLLAQYFGTADFYSYNLRKLESQAEDIVVNDEISQRRWILENRILDRQIF